MDMTTGETRKPIFAFDEFPDVVLGIGIPLSWPYCHSDFFDSFVIMEKPCISHVIRANSGPIDEMRNICVTRALEMGCTHVLFLDADMCYPTDTIRKLLVADKDIVGALCFRRWPPFSPCLFDGEPYRIMCMHDYPEDQLIRVTATGTGCLLIKAAVFETVGYPFFKFGSTPDGGPLGEDIGFCYKAKEAGFEIWVDTSCKTDHITMMRVNENLWKMNRALQESKQGKFRF